jgi:transcription initiation factor TFIIB
MKSVKKMKYYYYLLEKTQGLAAAILYLSCLKTGEKIRLNDIAQAAGVTELTLRNRFKDLKSKLELSN